MNTFIINAVKFSVFIAILISAGNVLASTKKVSPETVNGAKTIQTTEAKRLFDQGAAFIDVRSNRDWDAGRIPGSVHIELKKVFSEETLAAVTDKNQPVVIYCNSTGCMRSSKATKKAVGWGFSNVFYYRLGYPDWKSSGYAIE